MPNTYTLIASNTLSSSAASVTFSNIPNTYTDLVLKVSARTSTSVNGFFGVRFNNTSSTIYSFTYLGTNGSVSTSYRGATGDGTTYATIDGGQNETDDTSSTFSNVELYIPNYLSTTQKPFSANAARENNATFGILNAQAHLVNLTSAVTSLVLVNAGSQQFSSGSSFFLYGIKNS